MKWIFLFLYFQLACLTSDGQNLRATLGHALDNLEKDEQFAHALTGMYVMDIGNGNIIFERNAQVGLAPASCQKIITSATAFALLGINFHFATLIIADGVLKEDKLQGNLIIRGSGDPSLGSWRWPSTTQNSIFSKVQTALQIKRIKTISGLLIADDSKYLLQPVPDGWIWQDMGNYYGAGSWSLNWHENQYDLHLRSASEAGVVTTVLNTSPFDLTRLIKNSISSGMRGTGDNGYLYAAPFSETIFATGTIPPGEKDFVISGSLPNPPAQLSNDLHRFLLKSNIRILGDPIEIHAKETAVQKNEGTLFIIDSILSPAFDSLNYWFLKKSVNLYGEAFVKEIGYQKKHEGSTVAGLSTIKEFWLTRGMPQAELNILDGSGLSPANKVTCHALVTVMNFASHQTWFNSFYNALPEQNGVKMKDGYINGVRSYTGFVKSKSGSTYCFAFVVNNFDGSPARVREKMWKVIDLLK